MNILIVAATNQEILSQEFSDYDILISGVGMINACFELTKYLQENKPDIIINVGVAGAFKKEYILGDVLEVSRDCFSEMGVQNRDRFLNMSDVGLDVDTAFQYSPQTNLIQARGITVNTVHAKNEAIEEVVKRLNPDLESMEGAAFMLVCQKFNIRFIQIRSVSNYVEERNKEKWDLDLAIRNLNIQLRTIINNL
jgi:futalosine hydrolase